MTYQALSLTMTLNDLQKLLFELLDTLDRQCFEKTHHASSQKLLVTTDDVMCSIIISIVYSLFRPLELSRTFSVTSARNL